jgi:single-strand DNA-binding protein
MNPNTGEGHDTPHRGRNRGPSLNMVALIGRLAADPDMRSTTDGGPVARLRLATHWQDRTEYHTLVAFGPQARFAGDYLTRGRLVYAEGRLQARQWTAEDGATHRTTEVIVNNVQALGSRPERTEPQHDDAQRHEADREAER